MTGLLRRLFWRLSSVSVSVVLLFVVLSTLAPKDEKRLPLLFNPAPTSSFEEASSILKKLEAKQPIPSDAFERLGAILAVYAMPRLGGLSVTAQEGLLVGLRPVRKRMSDVVVTRGTFSRLSADQNQRELDGDLTFWKRFVEERGLDFHPPVRARVVRRWLAGELEMRRSDLLALDTYALPELVLQLGQVRSLGDVRRVRLLAAAISRVSPEKWTVSHDATPEEATRVVAQIRRFWDRNAPYFLDASPLALVAETLRQTEGALVLSQLGRGLRGIDPDDSLNQALGDAARAAPALASSGLGAFIFGPLAAAWIGLGRIRRPGQARASTEVPLLLGILLAVGLLVDGRGSLTLRLGLTALLPCLSVALLLTAELHERLDFPVLRVLERRSGRRKIVALLEGFAPLLPALLPVLVFEVALIPALCPWNEAHPSIALQMARAISAGQVEYPLIVGFTFALAVATLEALAEPVRGALGRGLEELH